MGNLGSALISLINIQHIYIYIQSTLDNSKLKNPIKNFELTNISNYQSSNYQRNRDKFEKNFELSNFIHMKIEKYNDKGMRGSLYLAHTRNLIVENII